MVKNYTVKNLSIIVIISVLALMAVTYNTITEWLGKPWSEAFYAVIFAILAALGIHIIYKPERKILQQVLHKTMYKKEPITTFARPVLPKNKEIKLTKNEEIFGREHFVGSISDDELQYIGKQHFKIIRNDDGRYIEDMDSANGTTLDNIEIKGSGQKN